MKKSILIITLLIPTFSMAKNYCKILMPERSTKNNKSCPSHHFGITYKGYGVAESSCYSSYSAAYEGMQNDYPACKKSYKYKNCKLLMPGKSDKTNGYCNNGYFGVMYKGHLTEMRSCHKTLQVAMDAMYSLKSCGKEPKIGKYKILMPGKSDKNRHYCSEQNFGITYKGYAVTEKSCAKSIDEAFEYAESLFDLDKINEVIREAEKKEKEADKKVKEIEEEIRRIKERIKEEANNPSNTQTESEEEENEEEKSEEDLEFEEFFNAID